MRKPDPEKRAERTAALLDAAVRCFAERGYESTRTADICADAGMSAGNLFHYFESKHAVLLAAIERDGDTTDAWIDELLRSPDPFAALLDLFDTVCDLAADRTLAGFALEVSAQAHRDEDVALRFQRNDQRFRDGLAELVRAAHGAGQLRTELSPDDAATWLAMLIDGVFARVEVQAGFDPRAQLPLLHRMMRLVLQGDAG